MANGFGSMYIGSSGLQSAQNALNTTANNLANVDTLGYVRQQVRFTDKTYNLLQQASHSTMVHQSGLGVSIGDVVHARDIFLDKSYRLEVGRETFYDVCYETTLYVEDLFQELDGEQFKQSVEDMWTAFQELAKTPADSVTQNLVIQKAGLLVSRTQSLYANLQSYQDNINDQILDDIDTLNAMGDRLHQLNLEIVNVEGAKMETAMTLRDERDQLLDEMATYANITVKEDFEGAVSVSIEGIEFVNERGCSYIGTFADEDTALATPYWIHLSDLARGQYVGVFHTDGDISSESNTDVGGIKAKMMMRGDKFGTYADLETEEAYSKIEDQVLVEAEAQIDLLFRSILTSMNDIFAPNMDYEVQAGNELYDANGNLLYAAGSNIKVLDVENAPVGADGKLPPCELFERMGVERYTTAYDAAGNEVYVYNQENVQDPNTMYRIGNIQVNDRLTKQVTLLPSLTQDGAVAFALSEKILAAWDEQGMHINPRDKYPCTFQGFYDKILGQLGTDGSIYKASRDTMTNTVTAVDNKRLQLTGVSSDEELTKLIKYQSAYNAASRYMTVISQMTELIVTGLK